MLTVIHKSLPFLFVLLLSIQLIFASTYEVKQPDNSNGLKKITAQSNLIISPMESADNLWKHFFKDVLPPGVTIHSIKYIGANNASGLYSNFPTLDGAIFPNDGIILTTGKAISALGPNNNVSESTDLGEPGDEELLELAKKHISDMDSLDMSESIRSYDAICLVIEFTTDTSVKNISFDFIYGSEEYPEFVNSEFNDIFCALLDGKNISYDDNNNLICINNDFFKCPNTDSRYNLQYDGFTPLLRTSVALSPGRHILKFAICDIGDEIYDSGVFLSRFKFSATNTGTVEVKLIEDQSFSVYENAAANTILGYIQTLASQSEVKFTIIDSQKEFLVGESDGKLSLSSQAVLNAAQQNKYTFNIVITVNNNLKDTALITVNVLPAEKKNLIDDQFFSIQEDAPANSMVGKIQTYSPQSQIQFEILDSQKEFTLNKSDGTITLSENAELNAAQKDKYTFRVIATAENNLKDTALITVNVIAVPKPHNVPAEALVFDDNGNGFIDRIDIILPDSATLITQLPSTSQLIDILSFECYCGHAKLQPVDLIRNNDHNFTIKITENHGTVFETGWKIADIKFRPFAITTDGENLYISKIIDKAGPVISKAVLESGDLPSEDKLNIYFSEPLSWHQANTTTPKNSFTYYKLNSLTENAFDNISATDMAISQDMLNAKVSITNGFYITPRLDSIQLKSVIQLISDNSGNPAHTQSRIAPIEGTRKNNITVAPSSNPYTPESILDPKIKETYANIFSSSNTKGLLIAIKALGGLSQLNDGSFGNAIIYDAVGNIVQKNIHIYKANTDQDFGFIWNGKNSKSRLVGNGMYLVIISVIDSENVKHERKIKIGFKRI